MKNYLLNFNNKKRAFTLIEVMVSVSIFAMVMLVATSSVFAIVESNKRTHSLKSVMTNLNFALEKMSREIRFGIDYSCNETPGGMISCGEDGSSVFSFIDANDETIVYSFSEGRITRREGGNLNVITAEEIEIKSMKFYLINNPSEKGKSRVTITLKGYAGTESNNSEFIIQTTISQWRETITNP